MCYSWDVLLACDNLLSIQLSVCPSPSSNAMPSSAYSWHSACGSACDSAYSCAGAKRAYSCALGPGKSAHSVSGKCAWQ
jgi:hypothetical protein